MFILIIYTCIWNWVCRM